MLRSIPRPRSGWHLGRPGLHRRPFQHLTVFHFHLPFHLHPLYLLCLKSLLWRILSSIRRPPNRRITSLTPTCRTSPTSLTTLDSSLRKAGFTQKWTGNVI